MDTQKQKSKNNNKNKTLQSLPHMTHKTLTKCIIDLSAKYHDYKGSRKNTGENLNDLRLDKDFFYDTISMIHKRK